MRSRTGRLGGWRLGLLVLAGTTGLAATEMEIWEQAGFRFEVPVNGIGPASLGVVINVNDPESIRLGEHYVARWGVPAENVVRVTMSIEASLGEAEANAVIAEAWAAVPSAVQGWALAWPREPFMVEGRMSITSAFAFGRYDEARAPQKPDSSASMYAPYALEQGQRFRDHITIGTTPLEDFGLRPAMQLAAWTVEEAIAMVDRAHAAQGVFPAGGAAYFASTADRARGIRSFGQTVDWLDQGGVNFQVEPHHLVASKGDDTAVRGVDEVAFYFTGTARVEGLETISFGPGGIGDNMTSFGGLLTGTHGQTVALDFIRQGAVGTYGTVFEPQNSVMRFPQTDILLERYLAGQSLLQAYWASVIQPGYGLFIGDPLARPFGGVRVEEVGGDFVFSFPFMQAGSRYRLLAGTASDEEWEELEVMTAYAGVAEAGAISSYGLAWSRTFFTDRGWTACRVSRDAGWTRFKVEAIDEAEFTAEVTQRDNIDRVFEDANAAWGGFEYVPWYGWIYTAKVDRSNPEWVEGWIHSEEFGWQYLYADRRGERVYLYEPAEFSPLSPAMEPLPGHLFGWVYTDRDCFSAAMMSYRFEQAEWIRYQGSGAIWIEGLLYSDTDLLDWYVKRPLR